MFSCSMLSLKQRGRKYGGCSSRSADVHCTRICRHAGAGAEGNENLHGVPTRLGTGYQRQLSTDTNR